MYIYIIRNYQLIVMQSSDNIVARVMISELLQHVLLLTNVLANYRLKKKCEKVERKRSLAT